MTLRSVAVLLLIAAAQANAAITFDLDSSLLYVRPGQTATFTATVTNDDAGTLFLNGISHTFPLPVDDTPFFAWPASLGPYGTWSGALLNVAVPPGTAPGLYTGTVNLIAGPDAGTLDLVPTETFGVQVVPEPSTLCGGLAAAVLAVVRVRRRSRKSQADSPCEATTSSARDV